MSLREDIREEFIKLLDSMEEKAHEAQMDAQDWVDLLQDLSDELDVRIEEHLSD